MTPAAALNVDSWVSRDDPYEQIALQRRLNVAIFKAEA
jgi:hypothetical protein